MIAIVGICKDEIDIIDLWLRHHFAEGIDHIYLVDASTDGTREVLESYASVTVIPDTDEYVQQAKHTNHLTQVAGNDGADWILPTDIDEFVYSVNGETVAHTLNECQHDKLYLRCWPHRDWQTRYVDSHRLPKVAFRYKPDADVVVGNHDMNYPGGEYDVLAMRELQFRGYDHFLSKARARSAVLSPQDKANGYGWHYTRLDGKTDEELRCEWEAITAAPTIADPIPTHLSCPLIRS